MGGRRGTITITITRLTYQCVVQISEGFWEKTHSRRLVIAPPA
jgi:hypothetical protein